MLGGRLSGLHVKRGGFEKNVRAGFFEPFADIVGLRDVSVLNQGMAVEGGQRIQSVGIGDPADAARGHSREPPANVVAAAKIGFFRDEQAQKGASHIAHADDGEIVGRHELNLREEADETDRSVCLTSGRGKPRLCKRMN